MTLWILKLYCLKDTLGHQVQRLSKVYKLSENRWTALLISLKEFPLCKWYCQWFQTVHCLGLRVSDGSRRGWTPRFYRQALRKHGAFASGLDLWFLRVSCMKAEFASLKPLPLPIPILFISPPPPSLEHITTPSMIIAAIYTTYWVQFLFPVCTCLRLTTQDWGLVPEENQFSFPWQPLALEQGVELWGISSHPSDM